jgi:hypothetical protein
MRANLKLVKPCGVITLNKAGLSLMGSTMLIAQEDATAH